MKKKTKAKKPIADENTIIKDENERLKIELAFYKATLDEVFSYYETDLEIVKEWLRDAPQ